MKRQILPLVFLVVCVTLFFFAETAVAGDRLQEVLKLVDSAKASFDCERSRKYREQDPWEITPEGMYLREDMFHIYEIVCPDSCTDCEDIVGYEHRWWNRYISGLPGEGNIGIGTAWGTFKIIPTKYCTEWTNYGTDEEPNTLCSKGSGSWRGTFDGKWFGELTKEGVVSARALESTGHGIGALDAEHIKTYDHERAGPIWNLTGYILHPQGN